MKIKKETKVQQVDKYTLKTSIPAIVRDTLGIKKGSKLEWILENENEVKITKKD